MWVHMPTKTRYKNIFEYLLLSIPDYGCACASNDRGGQVNYLYFSGPIFVSEIH